MPSLEGIKSVGRTLGILARRKVPNKVDSFSMGRRLLLLAAAGLLAACGVSPKEKALLVNGARLSLVSTMQKYCQDQDRGCELGKEYSLDLISTGKEMATLLGPLEDDIHETEIIENFKSASQETFELMEFKFKRDIDSRKVLGLESCKFKMLKPLSRR